MNLVATFEARKLAVPLSLVAVVLALLVPAGTARAQDVADRPTALIKVTNASLESAYTLAQGVCRGAGVSQVVMDNGNTSMEPNCFDVSYLEDERMLAVTATPDVIERIRLLLTEFDRMPETRSFHIIVLSASSEGGIADDVPASARTALEDVRDFLPFSGFSVLGSGWIRTSSQGRTTLAGAVEFIAELAFRPTTDAAAPLLIEEFSVYQNKLVSMTVDGNPTSQYMRAGRLESTFTISPGETVVVGTSKLNGDESAVVVLLTAVQN